MAAGFVLSRQLKQDIDWHQPVLRNWQRAEKNKKRVRRQVRDAIEPPKAKAAHMTYVSLRVCYNSTMSNQRQQDEQVERLTSLRARIDRSMNDPRPSVPAEEVFDCLRKMHEKNLKAVS
jgi:hypothetical protein